MSTKTIAVDSRVYERLAGTKVDVTFLVDLRIAAWAVEHDAPQKPSGAGTSSPPASDAGGRSGSFCWASGHGMDSSPRSTLGFVDSPEEILANKLCTLLSRSELRDLVDVRALEQAGYSIEDALEPASRKDGGLTAAQLAWVLSEARIGEDAEPPGVSAKELREYLDDLVRRLTRRAFPSEGHVR